MSASLQFGPGSGEGIATPGSYDGGAETTRSLAILRAFVTKPAAIAKRRVAPGCVRRHAIRECNEILCPPRVGGGGESGNFLYKLFFV